MSGRSLVLSVVAIWLVGCGGGSGAGSEPVPTPPSDNPGELRFAKQIGSAARDRGFDAAALSDGAVAVVGSLGAAVQLAALSSTPQVEAGAGGALVMCEGDGTAAWARWIPDAEFHGVAVLSDDSVVACGDFARSVTFGAGEPSETTLVSAGSTDAFLARFARDGSLLWAIRAGGTELVDAQSVATTTGDRIAIAGRFQGTVHFAEGAAGEQTVVSVGNQDVFLAQFDSDGGLDWARADGGPGFDEVRGIATRTDGAVLVTGRFGPLSGVGPTFGAGEANETVLTPTGSLGQHDIFLSAVSTDGGLLWAIGAGGDGSDAAVGVVVLSDDSCVIGGTLDYPEATFGLGTPRERTVPPGAFVARYDPTGEFSWVRRFAGGDTRADLETRAWAVEAIGSDGVALVGTFFGTITVVESSVPDRMIEGRRSPGFLAWFSSDGLLTKASRYMDSTSSVGWVQPRAIATRTNGSLAVLTEIESDVTIDPDGAAPLPIRSVGGSTDMVLTVFNDP